MFVLFACWIPSGIGQWILIQYLNWNYRVPYEIIHGQYPRCCTRVQLCELSCTRQLIMSCLGQRHVLLMCPVLRQMVF